MTKSEENFFQRLKPLPRTFISLAAGLVVFLALPQTMSLLVKIMLGWGSLAMIYLILCYLVISSLDASSIKRKAAAEDGNRVFVLILILISAFASFLGVFSLIVSDEASKSKSFIVVLSISVTVLSWLLIHTAFIFHYAYLYYRSGKNGSGLKFPDDGELDYLDFAYYSFCMGCTFQVSDVSVTSKEIRLVTMLHGLLAFVLNTFVLALAINIAAGMNH
ncbi:Uncharacterized membrane protein [bacterium A37T11]|nr:Uncharacterized membrane protein [bacterium A37T11]